MRTFFNAEQQNVGIGQNLGAKFGDVWRVTDSVSGTLITTSGRLNTTTLDDTITETINGFQNRKEDYIVVLNGLIVAILHPDDTFEYEP